MTKTTRTDSLRLSKKITGSLMLGWTAIIIISLAGNLYHTHQNILEKARIEALTLYELNLAYRSWAAGHGGVYVPVTEKLRPNPYLNVPQRDVTTKAGKELTLVNPAWMNRQVFEILGRQSSLPVWSHLTSLKNVNPVMVMPKRNGLDTYHRLQELKPGIKALFMSGYTADIIHKKGILEKGLLFISKPSSPGDLLRKVREALDGAQPGAS